MNRGCIAQPLRKSLPSSYKLFARGHPLPHGMMMLINLALGLLNTKISYAVFPRRSAEAKAKANEYLFTNPSAGRGSKDRQSAPGPEGPVRTQNPTRRTQMTKTRRLLPRAREARHLSQNLRPLWRQVIRPAAEEMLENRIRCKSRTYKTELSALMPVSRVWRMEGRWTRIVPTGRVTGKNTLTKSCFSRSCEINLQETAVAMRIACQCFDRGRVARCLRCV